MQWTLSNSLKVTIAGKFVLIENEDNSNLYELYNANQWKKIFPKLVYGDYASNLELYDALSGVRNNNDNLKSEALCLLYNKYLEEVIANNLMKT